MWPFLLLGLFLFEFFFRSLRLRRAEKNIRINPVLTEFWTDTKLVWNQPTLVTFTLGLLFDAEICQEVKVLLQQLRQTKALIKSEYEA